MDGCVTIAIGRLSHIGDCILTIPLATTLKRHWPGCKVVWMVEPPSDQLLLGHPAIDELLVVPKGWLGRPRELLQARQALRACTPDVFIDAQSLTKSAALGWIANVPRRIGFAAPVGRELAPWLNTDNVAPHKTHLLERTLELLSPLGLPSVRPNDVAFDLPIDEASASMVLAAGAHPAVEREIVAHHGNLAQGLRAVADEHGAPDRRGDLAVLDQVGLVRRKHELARRYVYLAAAEVRCVEPSPDGSHDLLRVMRARQHVGVRHARHRDVGE